MKVLVAAMGPYPEAVGDGTTTHDRFRAAAERVGGRFVVIPDLFPPGRSIGTAEGAVAMVRMHNWALDAAAEYDWLLLVENDAVLEPETLGRLLAWDVDVVAPYLFFPTCPLIGFECLQPWPSDDQHGLYEITRLQPTTVLLLRMSAVSVVGWRMLRREGSLYRIWRENGIRSYVDLDTTVDVLRIPWGFRHWVQALNDGERDMMAWILNRYAGRDMSKVTPRVIYPSSITVDGVRVV